MKRKNKPLYVILLCIALLLPFAYGEGDRVPSGNPYHATETGHPNTDGIYSHGLVNAPDGFALPEYEGEPWTVMNGGVPYANFGGYVEQFEEYAPLDGLGRCGAATALLGPETIPPEGEERGAIGSVKPSGWHTVKYNGTVDGNYLYNRCHLIAWSLSAENANPENLITGTRYLNVEGMLPFEMEVLGHIRETGGCVAYRSSPIFLDGELVPRGVLLEAESLDGTLAFCVFCHNVQPGVAIDYATGESRLETD